MPQLDTLSFQTQVFWFLIVFIGFYLTVANVYLPRITSLLTLRADCYSLIKMMASEARFLSSSYNAYVFIFMQEALAATQSRFLAEKVAKQFSKTTLSLEKTYNLVTLPTKNYIITK